MNTNNGWVDSIVEQISGSYEPWLSCDDCFDHADAVLEDLLERDVPLPHEFAAHLRGCAACHDEMEALAELAAEADGLSAAASRAILRAQIYSATRSQ